MKMRILITFIALSCVACGSAASHAKASPKSAHGITVQEKSSSVDSGGFRHIVVEVKVRGPQSVDIARCGGPAPVTMWAVDKSGKTLPDDLMYAQFCEESAPQVIPAGATKTYAGTAGYPTSSGAVTLHGTLALAGGKKVNLPVLQIP